MPGFLPPGGGGPINPNPPPPTGFTFGSLGGCNCCGCSPCYLPQADLFLSFVETGGFGGSASGALTYQGHSSDPNLCKWAWSVGAFYVTCSPGQCAWYFARYLNGGEYGLNQVGHCLVLPGMTAMTLSSYTCSPLNIVLTATGTGGAGALKWTITL